MRINNYRVLWETMRRGSVGFAASYIRGDVEVDDLTALFRNFLQNKRTYDDGKEPGMFRKAAKDLAFHLSRPELERGRQGEHLRALRPRKRLLRRVARPLDDLLVGALPSGNQSLEEAQRAKYHRIADIAGITAGSSVLEIGCGWGGFAETAIRDYGASVYGHHAVPRAARLCRRNASRGRASAIAPP